MSYAPFDASRRLTSRYSFDSGGPYKFKSARESRDTQVQEESRDTTNLNFLFRVPGGSPMISAPSTRVAFVTKASLQAPEKRQASEAV